MSEDLLEIMRQLDRECGIVDPLLKTPPAVTDRDGHIILLWEDDFGIPWLNQRLNEQRKKRWNANYNSFWMD